MDPVDELPEQEVHLDGVSHVWGVPGAPQQRQCSSGGRSDGDAAPRGNDAVVFPLEHQDRAVNLLRQGLRLGGVGHRGLTEERLRR